MKRLDLFCIASLLLAGLVPPATADVVQSSIVTDRLWMIGDSSVNRIHVKGVEMRLELPAGAKVDDIEPTRDGWLVTGRTPTADGSDLLLIRGGAEGADLMSVPARSSGRYRGGAVLAIEGGELVGLLWLEGDGATELEVRAAAWSDAGWGEPELVSAKGPGSQVSPRVSVLADGTWLAVWAAFDGNDDEIVWSRRRGDDWSPPERLHAENTVPDITPRIARLGPDAVAAWSRFDGNDYRLELARFVDGVWEESRTFGGRGSGDPVLFERTDGVWLLFQTVETQSWSVLEIDRSGSLTRLAVIPEDTYDRPLLLVDEAGDARLRWPELEGSDRPQVELSLVWRELP